MMNNVCSSSSSSFDSIRRHRSLGSKASSSDSIRSGRCQSVSSKRLTSVRSCSHSSSCAELHRSMQRRWSGYRDQHGMCSVQRRQIRWSLETLYESSATDRIQSEYVRQQTLRTTVHWSFAEVWYNIALCYYEMKQYAQAVQHLGAIVEKGIKDYPGKSIDRTGRRFIVAFFRRTECGNANRRNWNHFCRQHHHSARINLGRSIQSPCSDWIHPEELFVFVRETVFIRDTRCSSRHRCARSVDRHAAEKRERTRHDHPAQSGGDEHGRRCHGWFRKVNISHRQRNLSTRSIR